MIAWQSYSPEEGCVLLQFEIDLALDSEFLWFQRQFHVGIGICVVRSVPKTQYTY
jgi:hypothetical protein